MDAVVTWGLKFIRGCWERSWQDGFISGFYGDGIVRPGYIDVVMTVRYPLVQMSYLIIIARSILGRARWLGGTKTGFLLELVIIALDYPSRPALPAPLPSVA